MNDQALSELLSARLLAQRTDLPPPPAEAATPAAPTPEEAAAAVSAGEETMFPGINESSDMTTGDAVGSEIPTPLTEEVANMMSQILQRPSATETTQNWIQALMVLLVGCPVVLMETAAVEEQEEQP